MSHTDFQNALYHGINFEVDERRIVSNKKTGTMNTVRQIKSGLNQVYTKRRVDVNRIMTHSLTENGVYL